MDASGKILFWFREPCLLEDNGGIWPSIVNCNECIPVFCFDPRESQFDVSLNFQLHIAEKVKQLRLKLQNRRSNLLVVYHHYESIIPSIARVLDVTRVITHTLKGPNPDFPVEVVKFREQKLKEVRYHLSMHSIPLIIEGIGYDPVPDIFPAFPAINPGVIRLITSVRD